MIYQPGELKAVGYRDGQAEGEFLLYTAGEEVTPVIHTETQKIHADSQELVYVTVGLEDAAGHPNLYAVRNISVQVEGPGVLQGFGNADPQSENSYDDTVSPTYDGYVMAVVRSTGEKGAITVTFTAEGCGPVKTVIEAE